MKYMGRKFKAGFTMSELIIVLVIIGVLGYITFNKLFGAKTKQEIENSIKADLEVITNAADKYRLNSRDGKYTGLAMPKIAGYFPNNMRQMTSAGVDSTSNTGSWAGSISFGEMCKYTVASNSGNADRTFNLGMDCSVAITDLGWNIKEASLTEQVFFEFISRKYGYNAEKGLVDASGLSTVTAMSPSITTAGVVSGGIFAIDLSAAGVANPTAADVDGFIYATDLRGF